MSTPTEPAFVEQPGALARYVATTAPGGLALVQGILNTRATASGSPDLLDELATAQSWLAAGVAEWAERTGSVPRELTLTAGELAKLRTLRSRLRDYVAGAREGVELDVAISVVSTPDGTLRTQPTGSGVGWIASAAWGAVLMAQDRDTLRRLKLCRNESCGSAFYDRSKPNTGVWHDVRTCGNMANLHASRARRKARTA